MKPEQIEQLTDTIVVLKQGVIALEKKVFKDPHDTESLLASVKAISPQFKAIEELLGAEEEEPVEIVSLQLDTAK